jgi:(p)ppGpp synthase/HD superfamily hydrolase
LTFAERAHRAQTRKGTDIPYVSHLMAVAALVLEHGGDEDQGGAAIAREIRVRFNDRIADIVLACTDTDAVPKPPWRTRKEAYIASVETKPAAALLVTLADKRHNAVILEDHRRIGDAIWSRFTGGRYGTLWYYRALACRQPGPLADRLLHTVAELEAAACA